MSVTEFADHDCTVTHAADGCDRTEQRLRVRLADAERVLAADEGELFCDAKLLHQEFRRALQLVGADGLAPAGSREGLQRRFNTGVEPRLLRDVGIVVGQEVAEQYFELRRRKHPPRGGEASRKQHPAARSQHGARISDRQGRETLLGQNSVQRPHQVVGRVCEGAVEIVDDGRSGHRRLSLRNQTRRRSGVPPILTGAMAFISPGESIPAASPHSVAGPRGGSNRLEETRRVKRLKGFSVFMPITNHSRSSCRRPVPRPAPPERMRNCARHVRVPTTRLTRPAAKRPKQSFLAADLGVHVDAEGAAPFYMRWPASFHRARRTDHRARP